MTPADHNLPAELIAQIRAFVAQECSEPLDRILLNTRIEEDLGMTGDDAAEFLDAFAQRFQVNMDDLDFFRHFGPEGFNPLWLLIKPGFMNRKEASSVTVEHLARVAARKRWFSPEQHSGR